MEKGKAYIKIKKEGIDYAYNLFSTSEKQGGMYSYYIPEFEIHFCSESREEGREVSRYMTRAFFDYYIKEEKWKDFILKLHKLGFRSKKHNLILRDLIDRKKTKATFNIIRELTSIPSGMSMLDSQKESSKLQLA